MLGQTVDDFELLVVNDRGAEPAGLPSDSRLRVITRSENGGLAAARNTGLDVASGRYVAFLDDDDLYLPNRLELGLVGLARAPIALCMLRTFTNDPARPSASKGRKLEGQVHDVILDGPTPQAGRVSLERQIAAHFNEKYMACEDTEWWLRLSAKAPVTTVNEAGILQRGHDGPRHRNTAEARLQFHRLLLEDHAEYFASHRRARSFRYQRIGIRALALSDRTGARRALVRSLRERPSSRSIWHLARALRPERAATLGEDVEAHSKSR